MKTMRWMGAGGATVLSRAGGAAGSDDKPVRLRPGHAKGGQGQYQ